MEVAKKRRKWIDRASRDLDALRDAVEVQLHVLHVAAVRDFLSSSITSASATPGEAAAAMAALQQQPSIVDIVNQYQESLIEEDDEEDHVSSLGIFSWLSERTTVQFLHHRAGLSSRTATKIDGLFFNVLNRFERSQQKLKGQLLCSCI